VGLEALEVIGKAFSNIADNMIGLGSILVLAGFTMLVIIGVAYGIYYLIKALKMLPNLTVKELVKYTVIFAVALVIVGILLP